MLCWRLGPPRGDFANYYTAASLWWGGADLAPLYDLRFFNDHAARLGFGDRLTGRWLEEQDWPGNVRDLRHAVWRAVLLCGPDGVLEQEHFDENYTGVPAPAGETTAEYDLSELEQRAQLIEALERTAGNQTKAAKLLGWPRRTLVRRVRKYGLTAREQ